MSNDRNTIATGLAVAMTLVELLVVMVIMLMLATIVVAFAPGFQDAQKVARGADQLQMWLVSARQTAKSARVPSGLRLFINNGKVNELQYIQQPAIFTVPFAVPGQASGQPQTALLGVKAQWRWRRKHSHPEYAAYDQLSGVSCWTNTW